MRYPVKTQNIESLDKTSLIELLGNEKKFHLNAKKKVWGSRQFTVNYNNKIYTGSINEVINCLFKAKNSQPKDKFDIAINNLKALDIRLSKEFEACKIWQKPFHFLLHKIRQIFGTRLYYFEGKVKKRISTKSEAYKLLSAQNSSKAKTHNTPNTQRPSKSETYKPLSTQKKDPNNLSPLDVEDNQFENSPIKKYLGGTSDHTWKTYEYLSGKSKVRIGTWNLLDKCIGKNEFIPGNNPIAIKESPESYINRKKAQIQEIKALIQGQQGASPLDCFVFQEVDFYKYGNAKRYFIQKGDTCDNLREFLVVLDAFEQMLKDCGWKMIGSNTRKAKSEYDPLLTIYNPKTLKLDSQRDLIPLFKQDKVRGGKAGFTIANTQEKLAIINLHLNYSLNPKELVEEFQTKSINSGKAAIALGDLNRPPNYDGCNWAIGDSRYPTNVDTKNTGERGSIKKLSKKDARGSFNKVYDMALFSSGSKKGNLKETEMTYFVKNEKKGSGFHTETVNLNLDHCLDQRERWVAASI